MRKINREIVTALSEISQLGISVVVSFMIWIFIAHKIKAFFGLGNFVTVVGVIFGAGSAIMVFINFNRRVNKMNSEKNDNKVGRE